MNSIVNSLINLFFPQKCFICQRSEGLALCLSCQAAVIPVPPIIFPGLAPLDQLISFGVYRGVLEKLIKLFKFHKCLSAAGPLIDCLRMTISRVETLGDDIILVPVPLYVYKERERGFNQSSVLAARLSKIMGLRYRELLVRVKETPPLYTLSRSERSRVLKKAFEPVEPGLIRASRIILVDDVFTTGATLFSCARALKSAGAATVSAITIARA